MGLSDRRRARIEELSKGNAQRVQLLCALAHEPDLLTAACRIDAAIQRQSTLSLGRLAEALDLGRFILLGRGEEKTGGRRKQAILADCYEALSAAAFMGQVRGRALADFKHQMVPFEQIVHAGKWAARVERSADSPEQFTAVTHMFPVAFDDERIGGERLIPPNALRDAGFEVIVAGAGGAAHLPGMTAAKTVLPVIGVPVLSSTLNGLDSLLSIVQMPKGVPVATVAIGKAGAANAGLLAARIIGSHDPQMRERLKAYAARMAEDALRPESAEGPK